MKGTGLKKYIKIKWFWTVYIKYWLFSISGCTFSSTHKRHSCCVPWEQKRNKLSTCTHFWGRILCFKDLKCLILIFYFLCIWILFSSKTLHQKKLKFSYSSDKSFNWLRWLLLLLLHVCYLLQVLDQSTWTRWSVLGLRSLWPSATLTVSLWVVAMRKTLLSGVTCLQWASTKE